jgi:UDP-N-acetyl-D-mannosaminuronic acid dehydrogenase
MFNELDDAVQVGASQHVSTICVLGLGYVGLPAATLFALNGKRVFGVDTNPLTAEKVSAGDCLIVEPNLPERVAAAVDSGNLTASGTPDTCDAYIIAVPTPFHADSHAPDISFVEAALRSIAPHVQAGALIVLESTSPVGTTRHLVEMMRRLRSDLIMPTDGKDGDIDFAYSPERVIPGRTLIELVSNDRVIGGVTPRAAKRAADLYATFVKGGLHITDDRTAEMVKLSENTFRDVNIALANELSLICKAQDIDVWKMIELANRHPRVNILQPGPGVGGHCISVDPWFLVAGNPDLARLVRTAREVNDGKMHNTLQWVVDAIETTGAQKIACFGLTYKADIDDFRESPALDIALELTKLYPERVVVADPFSNLLHMRDPRAPDLSFLDAEHALRECDLAVMLVGHEAFHSLPRPSVPTVDVIGFWR